MSITTAKLLKIGGPLLTGIGGVFATSQLVSKSADEKKEEKLKTAALKDEEPPIEDYEDANEGECKKTANNQCKGGKEGPKSQEQKEGEQGGGGEQGGAEAQSQASGTDEASPREGKTEVGEKTTPEEKEGKGDEGAGASDSGSDEESGKRDDNESNLESAGTEEGAIDAENAHMEGTRYGTKDMGMTKQDLERTKQTKSYLEDYRNQLMKLIGV